MGVLGAEGVDMQFAGSLYNLHYRVSDWDRMRIDLGSPFAKCIVTAPKPHDTSEYCLQYCSNAPFKAAANVEI
jgi:hypothetical protein